MTIKYKTDSIHASEIIVNLYISPKISKFLSLYAQALFLNFYNYCCVLKDLGSFVKLSLACSSVAVNVLTYVKLVTEVKIFKTLTLILAAYLIT